MCVASLPDGFCYKVEELIITEIQGRGNATAN
eukprot:COSAG06_NODE_55093_length_291_cov_0.802083_1_plen_31_part_10